MELQKLNKDAVWRDLATMDFHFYQGSFSDSLSLWSSETWVERKGGKLFSASILGNSPLENAMQAARINLYLRVFSKAGQDD